MSNIPEGVRNSIAFNKDVEVQKAKREKAALEARLATASDLEKAELMRNIAICDNIIAYHAKS